MPRRPAPARCRKALELHKKAQGLRMKVRELRKRAPVLRKMPQERCIWREKLMRLFT